MELRVLRYFLTVAQEESFSRAAEKLHLSQPTLSRQLKELEDEFGKQLLIREPRRILLTDDGQLLRRRAEEILSLVKKPLGNFCTVRKSAAIYASAPVNPSTSPCSWKLPRSCGSNIPACAFTSSAVTALPP